MRMAFINLPVSDVKRSVEFFGQLGFEFNAEFSDEKTSCMIVEQNIFVMLLEEDRFKDFINGDIADAKRTTEVITCLSAESKEEVDDTVARAIAAGGKPWKPALQEGPMYGGSFQDLDGHVWELMYAAQA
ncbi:VOC family protein [Streptomyces buecherae]|uniref:VOC family protein n=1 Tax=Streptomyces buecherae TaxID=2763006 RepID=UPI00164E75E8|nr:VOC family protein [Streptomyces buecherae]MBC3982595.1 VOC family protein [Streptomyces buecherae]MBC3988824.1 VOC family protein [Streptomyces buecherae]QNJ40144.1 VOC family protein [Streptomyces buecherae]